MTAEPFASRIDVDRPAPSILPTPVAAPLAAPVAGDRAAVLAELSTRLAAALSEREVTAAVAHAIRAIGAQHAVVAVLDAADGVLDLAQSVDLPAAAVAQLQHLPLTASFPITHAVRTGQPVFVETCDDLAARFPDAATLLGPLGIRATASVPGTVGGRVRGAIGLGFDRPTRFDAAEQQFVAAVAAQCAQAVERMRLYDQAVTANQAKATFLATMSHELRTPLTAVLGYMELVMDEVLGPVNAAQREHLQRARTSGEHLLILIEDLLSFARIEAGREVVRAEPVELQAVLEDAVTLVQPLAGRKALPLRVEGTASGALRTDRQKLRQILVNLLANAVKFTEQGEVRLSTWDEGDELRIAVRDSGPGIAAEHLEQLFDPFWQVDQARTRRAGGTGLGLSVARQLAQLLGGDVAVASEVGRGSTFTVRLPREMRAES